MLPSAEMQRSRVTVPNTQSANAIELAKFLSAEARELVRLRRQRIGLATCPKRYRDNR